MLIGYCSVSENGRAFVMKIPNQCKQFDFITPYSHNVVCGIVNKFIRGKGKKFLFSLSALLLKHLANTSFLSTKVSKMIDWSLISYKSFIFCCCKLDFSIDTGETTCSTQSCTPSKSTIFVIFLLYAAFKLSPLHPCWDTTNLDAYPSIVAINESEPGICVSVWRKGKM